MTIKHNIKMLYITTLMLL